MLYGYQYFCITNREVNDRQTHRHTDRETHRCFTAVVRERNTHYERF